MLIPVLTPKEPLSTPKGPDNEGGEWKDHGLCPQGSFHLFEAGTTVRVATMRLGCFPWRRIFEEVLKKELAARD